MSDTEKRIEQAKLERHQRNIAQLSKSDTLRIDGMHPTIGQTRELAEAIVQAPKVAHLTFIDAGLDDDHVEILANALAQRNDLKTLTIVNCPYGDKGANKLFQGLQNHNLHALTVDNACSYKHDTIKNLCKMVEGSDDLHTLALYDIKMNNHEQLMLANALSDKKALFGLETWCGDQDHTVLTQSLRAMELPQLYNFVESACVDGNLHRSVEAAYASAGAVVMNAGTKPSFNQLVNIASFKSHFAAEYAENYEHFEKQLPVVEFNDTLTVQALFKPDPIYNICPVENTVTWLNHPDLLNKLAEKGELETAMQQTTALGGNLVQCALAFGDVQQNLDILQAQGKGISEIMATPCEDKTPNIGTILERRGEIGACFTYERWHDQKPENFVAAVKALPEHQQPFVGGYHSTQHQLQHNQKTTQHGR